MSDLFGNHIVGFSHEAAQFKPLCEKRCLLYFIIYSEGTHQLEWFHRLATHVLLDKSIIQDSTMNAQQKLKQIRLEHWRLLFNIQQKGFLLLGLNYTFCYNFKITEVILDVCLICCCTTQSKVMVMSVQSVINFARRHKQPVYISQPPVDGVPNFWMLGCITC